MNYVMSKTDKVHVVHLFVFDLELNYNLITKVVYFLLTPEPVSNPITCPFGVADGGIWTESDWIGACGYSGASDSGRLGNFPLQHAPHVTGLLNAADPACRARPLLRTSFIPSAPARREESSVRPLPVSRTLSLSLSRSVLSECFWGM